MDETPLHDILQLEEELRQRLAAEAAQLQAALALCERELAAGLAAFTQELQAEREERHVAACRAGQKDQVAAVTAAQERTTALAAISDDDLRAVLGRQLPRLWPGRWHDHPHGQG